MYGFVCLRISVERKSYTRRSKGKYIKSLRFSQNCGVYNTVKPAYNGTARDRNFFHDWQVPFNTGTWRLDLWDCKSFPLKTGFRSARVPLKRDFNLLTFVCSHFSYIRWRDIQQDVNLKLYLRHVVLNCVTTCPQCEALIHRIGFKCGFASLSLSLPFVAETGVASPVPKNNASIRRSESRQRR